MGHFALGMEEREGGDNEREEMVDPEVI